MSTIKLSISYFTLFILSCFLYSCYTQSKKQEGSEAPATNRKKPNIEMVSPETVGFDIDSLSIIDKTLTEFIDQKIIPGAVVLVARHGKVVYEKAYGWNDTNKKTTLKKDDIFRIASMTKPFTSVAIMQLYEQRKLQLTDPVSKYIPEFKNTEVLSKYEPSDTTWNSLPAKNEITIHHLLSHTSGLPYSFMRPEFGPIFTKHKIPELTTPLPHTIAEKTAALASLPLAHEPGSAWTYGLSTDVLGRVVEVASGQSLGDYIASNITIPLGLKDTKFFFSEKDSSRLVTPYIPIENGIVEMPDQPNDLYAPDYPIRGSKTYFSGGSGLCSTIRDYFVFCQTLLEGGEWQGIRLLQDSTISLMQKNQIGEITALGGKFGYGFHITTVPGQFSRLPGRIGWGGAFHTVFWIDPQRDAVAILMSQVLYNPYGDKVNGAFEQAVNQALTDPSL